MNKSGGFKGKSGGFPKMKGGQGAKVSTAQCMAKGGAFRAAANGIAQKGKTRAKQIKM